MDESEPVRGAINRPNIAQVSEPYDSMLFKVRNPERSLGEGSGQNSKGKKREIIFKD